jgi:hypothetical protein
MTAPEPLPVCWALWRQVVRTLGFRHLLTDSLATRQAWSQWAWDYVTGLRGRPATQRLIALLAPVEDRTLKQVLAIGRLNHRRLAASARWMSIAFVTVPASAALTLSELAPGWLKGLKDDFDRTDTVALTAIIAIVLYQIVCAWQARQVLNLLEIAAVERGLFPNEEDEPEEGAIEPPIGS